MRKILIYAIIAVIALMIGLVAFSSPIISGISELFSSRKTAQTVDLTDAVHLSLVSDKDITITEEGVYVISGFATDSSIVVDGADGAKIQLVLDGVSVANQSAPVIYIKSAEQVIITTTTSDNDLKVTGTYSTEKDTHLDAVIYAKDDLILNGLGTLNIISAYGNGISAKDTLTITGGSYSIVAQQNGLEAHDAIKISGGNFTISSGRDALHSENKKDPSVGSVHITDGEFDITAGDDAIRATTTMQIDGGTLHILSCTEGIEGTFVQINDGDITIFATDDGINATKKSNHPVS
ncbi:MAG: carbohydrate-binding domain-containing protein, partial [Eubacteriales bacterium]